MGTKPYAMGDLHANIWRGNESQHLTFVVTQECNLRCGYCYMVGKNDMHRMDFETAKKIVDYFVNNKDTLFTTDYVVLDFIGGEPLLEIELIDKIVDYFRLSVYKKKSKWFGRFRILIQSNGVLVSSEKFRKFLRKNHQMVSVGITIDGIKEKHDMQRVFPNGHRSYDIVEKNYKMFFKEGLTKDTKVTFGHEDLKYLKDSIIHLWKLGIKSIPANVVHEDVWKTGDDTIYEQQLIELADYAIDNHLWKEYNTSFFYDKLGFKANEDAMMSPSCGTGNMYCVDSNGDIYNCVRFMDYSLNGKPSKKIGDIYKGVDEDRKRPLKTLFPRYISDKSCINCRVSMNCSYCSGNNYDASDSNSMFYRPVTGCNMHKARVRANNYFWARLYNECSIKRDVEFQNEFYMYFILSSNCVSFCDFQVSNDNCFMRPEDLIEGLEYAFQNFYQPVFVHSDDSFQWMENVLHSEEYGKALSGELKRHIVRHIMKYQKEDVSRNVLYVVDELTDVPDRNLTNPVILNIDACKIEYLAERVIQILPFTSRININLLHMDNSFDLNKYEEQLQRISDVLIQYMSNGEHKEVRQLTDRIFAKKMNNCFAGEKNITLAPDGKYYFCPAFYFDKNLNIDFDTTKNLTVLSKAPICDNCDAYQCNRCIYKNYVGTGELNVSTKIQCSVSHLERKYSAELLKRLQEKENNEFNNFHISPVDYSDPIEQFNRSLSKNSVSLFCYND